MDYLVFATYLAACSGAAATGAVFSPGPWYRALKKPVWTPKDWMFPVVWTTLYFLMAGAAMIASQEEGSRLALALWALQITLNTLWTPIFFGLRRIRAGMLVMTFLWLAVAATTVSLATLSTTAGLLFLPYLLWVTIAGALNFWVMLNNPDTGYDGAVSGA